MPDSNPGPPDPKLLTIKNKIVPDLRDLLSLGGTSGFNLPSSPYGLHYFNQFDLRDIFFDSLCDDSKHKGSVLICSLSMSFLLSAVLNQNCHCQTMPVTIMVVVEKKQKKTFIL